MKFNVKIKRFISTATVACLLVMVFGMFTAFADGELTITYWNADSTSISVDFSTAIDETTMEGKISLTKDGVDVPFTYEKNMVDDSIIATGTSTESVPEKGLSYTITPIDGITLESVYSLTIDAGVESSDGSLTLSDAFTKQFVVHKLFSDDFDSYDTTDNLITSAWYNNKPENISMTSENGKMRLDVTAASNHNIIYPYEADNTWSDYTFEAEITVFPGEVIADRYHNIQMFAAAKDATPDLLTCPMVDFKTRDFNKMGQSELKGTTTTGRYYFYTTQSGYKDSIARVSKLAIKGNNIKFYLDGKQTLEAKTNTSTIGRFGFSPRMHASYGAASYYVDNVMVTKTIECFSLDTTPSNGAQDVLVDSDVTIVFPQEVDEGTITKDNIIIEDEDGAIENYDVALSDDGKTVIVTFDSELKYKTKYTVKAVDVKFKGSNEEVLFADSYFNTIVPPFDLVSFSISEGNTDKDSMSELSGKTFTAKATVKNNYQSEPQRCIVSLVLYNENEQMCAIKCGVYTLALDEDETLSYDFTLGADSGYYVKCYVWDSFANMNKLFEAMID